jgi:hypothetical protein
MSEKRRSSTPYAAALAGAGGVAAAWVLVSRWLPHVPAPSAAPWLIGLGVGFAVAVVTFAVTLLWERRRAAPPRRVVRLLTLLGFLSVGALTLFVIPVTMPPLAFSSQESLTVTATGKRNPQAKSSEVWLSAIQRIDGTNVPVDELTLGDGWVLKDGIPLSHGRPPAKLSWSGPVRGQLVLRFYAHPWSGIAAVTWRGETQRVDLYAPDSSRRHVRLPVPPPVPYLDEVVATGTYVAHVVLIGLAALLIGGGLARVPTRVRTRCGAWRWLLYGGVCAVAWGVSLAAYWPALMSSDSIDQWREMIRWDLTDAHPALSTMIFWLVTRVYESPAAIAVFQIVVLAAISGWGLWRLRRDGVPAIIIWLTLVVYATSTVNSRLVITIWKDVLFSALMLLFVLVLREIAASRGQALRRWSFALTLVVSGVLISVLRHNGLPAVVGGIGVFVLFYPRTWWRLLLIGVEIGGGIVLVRGPVYRAAGVEGVFSVERLTRKAMTAGGQTMYQLAAHLRAGTPLEPDERAMLEAVAALDDWGGHYDPFRRTTMRKIRYNRSALKEYREQLPALLAELNARAPQVYWRHVYWRTALVWRIGHPHNSFYSRVLGEKYGSKLLLIHTNPYGVKPHPISPEFQRAFARWMTYLQRGPGFWLNWRPALQLWVLLGALVVAAVRTRNASYLALAVPILIHSYFVATLAPAQDFRYQYPVYLCGMLMAPALLLVARRDAPATKPTGPAADETPAPEDDASGTG